MHHENYYMSLVLEFSKISFKSCQTLDKPPSSKKGRKHAHAATGTQRKQNTKNCREKCWLRCDLSKSIDFCKEEPVLCPSKDN